MFKEKSRIHTLNVIHNFIELGIEMKVLQATIP